MKLSATARLGFTVLELVITIVCLFVLAAISLPYITRSRVPHCRINCTNNLKQIGLAFRTWALDNGDKYPMSVSVTNGGTMELVSSGAVFPHFMVMSNELSTPKVLICPAQNEKEIVAASTFNRAAGGQPNIIPFTNNNNVSYFVGPDATDSNPQMILCGDANLLITNRPIGHGLVTVGTNLPVTWSAARHVNQGNIGLADGSVQQFNSARLWQAFKDTGSATNRLLIP
jgi:prepilin-type processing-associated H-X9-DG protein